MMDWMVGWGGGMGLFLLRNLVVSAVASADTSLLKMAQKYNLHHAYNLLRLFHKLLISSFLFFLGILPSFISLLLHTSYYSYYAATADHHHHRLINANPEEEDGSPPLIAPLSASSSGIARAVSQLLLIASDVPVSSRKYELVRSLAELLIDDNHRQGFHDLNRRVLSAAFARGLQRLEGAAAEQERERERELERERGSAGGLGLLDWIAEAVRRAGEMMVMMMMRGQLVLLRRPGGGRRCEYSAEKSAAELLWLARKMGDCGMAEEGVYRWAWASKLASLGLQAEPRLQGCLLSLSAFLIKQAKTMRVEHEDEQLIQKTRSQMLVSWLPMLCRASSGTDSPVLSISERAELGTILEETIETLSLNEQERVLSLWLHHFSHCSESDWPNLKASFLRWCTASRKHAVLK